MPLGMARNRNKGCKITFFDKKQVPRGIFAPHDKYVERGGVKHSRIDLKFFLGPLGTLEINWVKGEDDPKKKSQK